MVIVCPTDGCSAVLHLTCAAASGQTNTDHVVPLQFKCRTCHGNANWVSVAKEASVRVYGGNLMDKVLKSLYRSEPAGWTYLDSDAEDSDSSSGRSLILVENPDQW
jgi:hypothetical protein